MATIYIKQVQLKSIAYNQVFHTSFLKFLFYKRFDNKKFVKTLVEDGIDVLHINSSVFPQILESIKKYSNIKTITHVREFITYNKKAGKLQQYMINQIHTYSDSIIAISDNEAAPFINHPNLYKLCLF